MITLANVTASATGAQAAVAIERGPLERTVQCVLSSTGTVAIQGSDDNVNWVTMYTFTTSDGQIVAVFPYMRANVSANTGSVTVFLDACKV